MQDAEEIVGHLQSNAPNWNHDKIYLDLFPAIATSSGNTYPLAYNAIQQTVQDGTLLINYTGHGNYLRLSEEAVISQPQFDSWNNREKLPLMVTASCNFAPYDQPELSPIAWDALMKNGKGIIGLVAASRLVFAYSNKQINDLFIQQLFVPDSSNNYPSIGQALQKAKVKNWAQGGDHINAFKFSLLGDPALRLLSPNYKIAVQQLNGNRFTGKDTLLSRNKYTLQGYIQSGNNVNNSFNGVVELIIYDAVKYQKTLANQATSMSVPIAVQENKQVYIFIEKNVLAEFETFLLNKDAKIKYKHVDDVRIYNFIEEIKALPNNNNIKGFETNSDIIGYLKEQFAGLFQRFLQNQSRIKEISLINKLDSTSKTLNQLVTFLSQENKESTEEVNRILMINHPIVEEIKEYLEIEYLFYIQELLDVENLLKARGFNGINADENYWNFEYKRRNKKQRISISRDIFDDDFKLKLFKKSEWKKSYVKFNEIDEEEHDDLPF